VDEYFDFKEYKEGEYDKLAAVLRNSLDIPLLYKIMDGEKIGLAD
jgi:hypothetical protein